jgi:ankyrin repeat protein
LIFFNLAGRSKIYMRAFFRGSRRTCDGAVLLFVLALLGLAPACRKADPQGSALRRAAANGDVATMKALLQQNSGLVFSEDKTGGTALQYAALHNRKDAAEILLAGRAKVDARDDFGITSLYTAAAKDSLDVVRVLIAAKADVDANDSHGFTPLAVAAYNGHTDVAEVLLDSGANVNAKDGVGRTPLHWARKNGHEATESLLRQRGGLELPLEKREWP